MNEPDLIVRDLRVTGGGRTLLAIDELIVRRGEVVAILGPNGAGKSTLLRTCLGWQRPAAGRVRLLDIDVTGPGRAGLRRLRQRVGYVPQQLAAHSHMPLTTREIVAIGRTGLRGLLRPLTGDDWSLVDAAIEQMGLAALRDAPYATLSGGEQRKTLIARALVQQPPVLMLDEPTANLDLGWREHLVATIDETVTRTGVTTLLVCHELEVLPPCCERLVVLREGGVIADGRPDEVLTQDLVSALYGGGLTVRHAGGRHMVVPAGADGDA